MRKPTKTSRNIGIGITIAFAIAVVAIAASILLLLRADEVGDHGDIEKQGIDISHHQGEIDWQTVAKSGMIKFAYIKASEGAGHQDTRYKYNTEHARAAGIAVGSYHYFRPEIPVEQQYNNFMQMVSISTQDLIPVIDVEERGHKPSKQICDSLKKFTTLVEAQWGVRPIIYTHQRYYNVMLQQSFDSHILWIARYGIYKYKPHPTLEDNRQCGLWQYSNRGRIEGIKGDVDLNTLYGEMDLEDISLVKQITNI